MKIAMSGASGFVGQAVRAHFEGKGHDVVPLVRERGRQGIFWDPESGEINRGHLEGFDVCIHLAGENVAARRWSKEQKAKIRDSRIKGTSLLVKTLSGLSRPPQVLVSASASGIYGPAVWEPVDESAPAGHGFLAEVCRSWEFALRSAPLPGTRIAVTRFGLVLGNGGILAKIVPPFRFGLGGKIGGGHQWMSWISIRDTVRAIDFTVENQAITGPMNVVSPHPVTNAAFTAALAKALHRPAFCTVPARALTLIFGEMAEETALASSRLVPRKLLDHGFHFEDEEILSCLAGIVRKRSAH